VEKPIIPYFHLHSCLKLCGKPQQKLKSKETKKWLCNEALFTLKTRDVIISVTCIMHSYGCPTDVTSLVRVIGPALSSYAYFGGPAILSASRHQVQGCSQTPLLQKLHTDHSFVLFEFQWRFRWRLGLFFGPENMPSDDLAYFSS